jgi:TM2 domain-containing membrane protein YozV
VLFLADIVFLRTYLQEYERKREHEIALVATAERARRWGSASMEVQDDPEGLQTGRTVTVHSSSVNAAIDAFHELDASPPITVFTTWVCWLPFGGLLGLHHLYLGRYWHFALAACTLNLFLVGWVADAFLLEWYIQDAMSQFSKAAQAAPAHLLNTEAGMANGLPVAPSAMPQAREYDTESIVPVNAAQEATAVPPPPVPGSYAAAAATPPTTEKVAAPTPDTGLYPNPGADFGRPQEGNSGL